MKQIDTLLKLLKATEVVSPAKDEDDEKLLNEDEEEKYLAEDDDEVEEVDMDVEDEAEAEAAGEEEEEYEDEDEDEDEYNEEYVKKYLKRYAKENEEEFKKFCKEMGILQKAIRNKVPEGIEADAVMIDGTGMFKAFAEFADAVTKEMKKIKQDIADIKMATVHSAAIAHATGEVVAKAYANNYEKSKIAPKGTMFKAIKQDAKMDISTIKQALYKAAINGDQKAPLVMTKLESCGGNLNLLGDETINYISNLLRNGGNVQ